MRHRRDRKRRIRFEVIATIAVAIICIVAVYLLKIRSSEAYRKQKAGLSIPTYSGRPFVEINGNKPYFLEEEYSTESFEVYSDLDSLGRCGVAFANVSRELMPTEPRGEIGSIKPTGWVQAKYEGVVESNPPYLYNRCHLIAYCLTAENANEKNLITGTRYMNVVGMLPFEEQVARYLDANDNHVLYRVTPIFEGRNLVASGVLMEAYSVEDKGAGVSFCVYVYNVQPGIEIDYATGKSKIKDILVIPITSNNCLDRKFPMCLYSPLII